MCSLVFPFLMFFLAARGYLNLPISLFSSNANFFRSSAAALFCLIIGLFLFNLFPSARHHPLQYYLVLFLPNSNFFKSFATDFIYVFIEPRFESFPTARRHSIISLVPFSSNANFFRPSATNLFQVFIGLSLLNLFPHFQL